MIDTTAYWTRRHAEHAGTWRAAGAGSHGRLAVRKAHLVNSLTVETAAGSLLDVGCGDGSVAQLFDVARYHGIDPSPVAVERCRRALRRRRPVVDVYDPRQSGSWRADVAISMDVVFHLIDDHLYERHLEHLFGSARSAVGIYTTDHDAPAAGHMRHRHVTADVARLYPGWALTDAVGPQWTTAEHGRHGSDNWWLIWSPR